MLFTLFLIVIVGGGGLLLLLLYFKFKANYKTWDRLGVVCLPPTVPFGNITELISQKSHFGLCYRRLYDKLRVKAKKQKDSNGCAGIYVFGQPYLFAIEPEFCKTILVRDFNTFVNRGVFYNGRDDPISRNIFFTEDEEWKCARQKLSFAFTSGKMKTMWLTLNEVGNQLVEYILSAELTQLGECNVKELMAGFTTDVVSSCIFGLQSNCLMNPDSEFRHYSRRAISFSKLKLYGIFLATSFPVLARRLGFRVFDAKTTQFFRKIVSDTVKYRRESGIDRNDLMQILIKMMSQSENNREESISLDEIVANAFIFFFAGFETSSTALSVCLYYLSLNPEIQEAVRKEINSILSQQSLTYENLNEMHLLDRVVLETLRMHPPVATLHRVANKPYQLANGSVVPTGTGVIVPILGLHYDPEFWPEPDRFDPDRFRHDECQKRPAFSYLPFGEGNRICIGQRFALMQIKVGLIKILRNFRVSVCSKTQIPLQVDPTLPSYVPIDVWLTISKLNKNEIISSEL